MENEKPKPTIQPLLPDTPLGGYKFKEMSALEVFGDALDAEVLLCAETMVLFGENDVQQVSAAAKVEALEDYRKQIESLGGSVAVSDETYNVD